MTNQQKTIYDNYMNGYLTGLEAKNLLVPTGLTSWKAWQMLGIDKPYTEEWADEKERLENEMKGKS